MSNTRDTACPFLDQAGQQHPRQEGFAGAGRAEHAYRAAGERIQVQADGGCFHSLRGTQGESARGGLRLKYRVDVGL